MASCLDDTEEKTNGTKLSRLLIDGGTEVLRSTLDNIHPPATLTATLHTHLPALTHLRHKKRILNISQWDNLFPPGGAAPDSKQFDITLLYTLLRNICGLAPPATGWNSLPLPTDTTLEAHLARIKYYRNEVYGHISSTGVQKAEFEQYWKEISGALAALGMDHTSIDVLKSSPLGVTDYNRMIEEWSISEQEMKEVAQETKKEIQATRKAAEKTILSVEAGIDKMEEVVKESAIRMDALMEEVTLLRQQSQLRRPISKLAKSDFTGHVKALTEHYHPGTRALILSQIQQLAERVSTQMMLLTAQPGVGKSVVAAVACQQLEENGQLAASHFIEYNNSLHNTPRLIIESIASHLCDAIPGFRQKLEETLSRDVGKDLNSMNCAELFNVLLEEPLNATEDLAKSRFIVIDALDECDSSQQSEFVKSLFLVIPRLPKWMKFVITTRPPQDLTPKTSSAILVTIEPEDSRNMEDIELYLKSELNHLYRSEQVQTVIPSLVIRSGGIFLFAHLVVDFARHSKQQLSELSKIFLNGISSVYEEYIERLSEAVSIDKDKFFNFLAAVVAAKNPLPESVVLQILALSGDSPEIKKTARHKIKQLSHLFPSQDQHITVFHKSLADWLIGADFSVQTKDGHRILASLCFEYLQSVKIHASFPPPVNDCEKYALRFGCHHMLEAGGYKEQLKKCVCDLEILSAKYCLTSDRWYGLEKGVLDELLRIKNSFSWDWPDLQQFIDNLHSFRQKSFQLYPNAILEAAVHCPTRNKLRQQAVLLLGSPKYADHGWIEFVGVSMATRFARWIGHMGMVAVARSQAIAALEWRSRSRTIDEARALQILLRLTTWQYPSLLAATEIDTDVLNTRMLPDVFLGIAFSNGNVLTGNVDGNIHVWKLDNTEGVLTRSAPTSFRTVRIGATIIPRRTRMKLSMQSLDLSRAILLTDEWIKGEYTIAVSPDATKVAVLCQPKGSYDRVVHVFCAADNKLIKSLPVVFCLSILFLDNTHVIIGEYSELHVWNIASGEVQRLSCPGSWEVHCFARKLPMAFLALLSPLKDSRGAKSKLATIMLHNIK